MTIIITTAIAVVGFLAAFRMYVGRDERELRTRSEIEFRMQEARNTEKLFELEHQRQLKQATVIGEAEHEVAKTKRLEAERKLAQVHLAKETISMFGSYRGDRLLEAPHNLTIDGLLAAVARQLDDLPPDPMAIKAANSLTRQRQLGEQKEAS